MEPREEKEVIVLLIGALAEVKIAGKCLQPLSLLFFLF